MGFVTVLPQSHVVSAHSGYNVKLYEKLTNSLAKTQVKNHNDHRLQNHLVFDRAPTLPGNL